MVKSKNTAGSSTKASTAVAKRDAGPPRRYIYNDNDMQHFLQSPAKQELLRFTNAMGKSCAMSMNDVEHYRYDPDHPLVELTPSLAVLHGALRGMLTWVQEIPPIQDRTKVRFGNPAFRTWHTRLVQRSVPMMYRILMTHHNTQHPATTNESDESDPSVLEKASQDGYDAAVQTTKTPFDVDSIEDDDTKSIVIELCAYFCAAFGHEMRIDYGTGHECSFQVLLYALCKIGCFGGSSVGGSDKSHDENSSSSNNNNEPPSPKRLKAITMSLYNAYLQVTRQLQTDYMLEPAGSHGVWGLDDYHCLPFYFGSCQLSAINPDDDDDYDDIREPRCIHNDSILNRCGDKYLYLSCIRYIKQLKKGVPFFESSPMLNDISHLPTWTKVSSGLLRLFEGEVLMKRVVVQHFVFGRIFTANWIPSEDELHKQAPTTTFRTTTNSSSGGNNRTGTMTPAVATSRLPPALAIHPTAAVGPMTRAPWANDNDPPSSPVSSSRASSQALDGGARVGGMMPTAMPTTRAPWATSESAPPPSSSSSFQQDPIMPPVTRAPWATTQPSPSSSSSQQGPNVMPPVTRAPWAK